MLCYVYLYMKADMDLPVWDTEHTEWSDKICRGEPAAY